MYVRTCICLQNYRYLSFANEDMVLFLFLLILESSEWTPNWRDRPSTWERAISTSFEISHLCHEATSLDSLVKKSALMSCAYLSTMANLIDSQSWFYSDDQKAIRDEQAIHDEKDHA